MAKTRFRGRKCISSWAQEAKDVKPIRIGQRAAREARIDFEGNDFNARDKSPRRIGSACIDCAKTLAEDQAREEEEIREGGQSPPHREPPERCGGLYWTYFCLSI